MVVIEAEWQWECAGDADEVHALLEDSDRAQATALAPAPRRNRERTRHLVEGGCVHLLRQGAAAVAMFSLTDTPPFDPADAGFPPADRPLYLQRLAIASDCARTAGAVPGISALRRAIEIARARRADALRSQANPDLARTMRLLTAMGFQPFPPLGGAPEPHRVYMELRL